MIGSLFKEIFYRPIFNALIVIYNFLPFKDLGLSIILLTIVVRLILYPLFRKSMKHQTIMQKIQPKVAEIQKQHKDDKQKQSEMLMALYREHNINPFSGIFLIFLQLPVFIALYSVFAQTFNQESFQALYPFISAPAGVHQSLLGLINLHESSIILVVVAAVFQFLQGLYSLPPIVQGRELSVTEKAGRQMVYFAPMITLLIFWRLPSAIALYWGVSSAFSFVQQLLINRHLSADVRELKK